jgi:hypothetical protein
MDNHFPSLSEEQQRAQRLGIDVEWSYRMMILELAPTKAKDLLRLPSDPERTCVVCEKAITGKAKTCSGACRTRLFRINNP